MKYLYKYPQKLFHIMIWNKQIETGTSMKMNMKLPIPVYSNDNSYFDVFIEYAKNDEEDICIRVSVYNRSAERAPIPVLPTLWMRNIWSYELTKDKPVIKWVGRDELASEVKINQAQMGDYSFYFQNEKMVLLAISRMHYRLNCRLIQEIWQILKR